jgi:hypothetical protein
MDETNSLTRRSLLATGVATTAALAGCGNSGDSDQAETAGGSTPEPTPTQQPMETATEAPTETPTETPPPTPEDPAPSLSEFEYPPGTGRDGVDGSLLFSAHKLGLEGAETATLSGERLKVAESFQETLALTTRLGTDGLARTVEDQGSGRTQSLWSAGDQEPAYVRMKGGFDERYRIDNRAPSRRELLEFRQYEFVLAGTAWSEATEVVEVGDDEYGVTYESTGIADEEAMLRVVFGDAVMEFEATVTVSEAEYVSKLEYDITVERDDGKRRETVTRTVDALGETTVEEPDWVDTAREKGVRFEMETTDDGTAVELEMVNGEDVPGDARAALADARARGSKRLSEATSVGDSRYLGLSGSGELLVDSEAAPADARELESFARATVRHKGFLFFRGSMNFRE